MLNNITIKIAIATNINFHTYSIPILLNSLIESGIDKEDIYIFNSGFNFNDKTYRIVDGIKWYFLNQNSFEYSPLIEIVERELESDYWFLIHDTCKVGNKFKDLLYNIPKEMPDKIALKSCPSMSIGSYRYDYLLKNKEKLLSIKNTDLSNDSIMEWKRWGIPNEDFILWLTPPKPIIYNNIDTFKIIDYENWYNMSVKI